MIAAEPHKMDAARPWDLSHLIAIATIRGEDWPHIDTGGDGPALVMLPGSVGTCEMFFKQVATLGRDLRVISVSYPALSDPCRLADGLAGLLDHLRLDHAHILGSSFGGYWAQFFALRHPHRVETLFLGNTFVSPHELFRNPLFAPDFIRSSAAAELQAVWRDRVAQAPASELKAIQLDMLSGRQSAENLKARFTGVVDAVPCSPLPIPHSRIVVIDCADDPIIPPASRRAVAEAYPGAAHHTLGSGGHYPHILNQAAYDRIILTHLKSHNA